MVSLGRHISCIVSNLIHRSFCLSREDKGSVEDYACNSLTPCIHGSGTRLCSSSSKSWFYDNVATNGFLGPGYSAHISNASVIGSGEIKISTKEIAFTQLLGMSYQPGFSSKSLITNLSLSLSSYQLLCLCQSLLLRI